jgi:hypothetical protein
VIPRHCENRPSEAAQELGGLLELVAPAAVREVAARDDELRVDAFREPDECLVRLR